MKRIKQIKFKKKIVETILKNEIWMFAKWAKETS